MEFKKFPKTIFQIIKNKFFIGGIILTLTILFLLDVTIKATSTNSFCVSCHTMKQFEESYKKSSHYTNQYGITPKCTDCHLPPNRGLFDVKYVSYKAYLGTKDAAVQFFGDVNKIDWDEKLKHKEKYVFDEACMKCHQNLLPPTLLKNGIESHKEYLSGKSGYHCTDCHSDFVHFSNNE